MRITMHEVSKAGQLSLVYIYPDEIEGRAYTLTIKNVPLP